jgi:CRISPR-associated protein Csm2
MSGRFDPQRGGQTRNNPQGGGGGQENRLPEPKEIKYFSDIERKAIKSELLDQEAQKWARSFEAVNTSQLRRFYGDVTHLARQIDRDEQGFTSDMIKCEMALLKAKAVYAKARLKNLPEAFLKFFIDHAASVKDVTDFRAFQRIFEAVIAYHRYIAKD